MNPEEQKLEGKESCLPGNKVPASLKGDRANIALLLFLYLLQGLPLGLAGAVPMILQTKGVLYKDQALFSLVGWPYGLKLLWAPIVDCVFWEKFGRRKSWIVPIQYLIGTFMLGLSSRVDIWIEDPAGPRMVLLTALFFMFTFLAATQDVVVDGWALTMLRRENVGHASTCNSIGQTAGFFLGFFVFMALESPDFCNSYLRSEPQTYGVVTLSSCLFYTGWVFLATTTLLWLFKKERALHSDDELPVNILDTYKQLWRIVQLPTVKICAAVFLTLSISFSACDAISWLKLIGAGIPRERFAMVTVSLIPLKMLLVVLFSKHLTGNAPMEIVIKMYPYRLLINIVLACFIFATPYMIQKNHIPLYFYALLAVIYGILQVTMYTMYVAKMAFFARSSDPALGGTYMTLLNTLNNVGTSWPSTVMLLLVDPLTFKRCSTDDNNTCSTPQLSKACMGECVTIVDGYYILIGLSTVFGLLWLLWGHRTVKDLQRRGPQHWKVKSQRQLDQEQAQRLKQ